MATAGVDPELQEAGVELGRVGHDADVTTERQVHAGADCGSVDRGQRRQRAAGDAEEPLVDRAEALARRLGEIAQVRSRAEGGWGTGDDEGADGVVGLERVHRLEDLRHHRGRGQRVPLVGIVQRERHDAVGHVGEHEWFSHVRQCCTRGHGDRIAEGRRGRRGLAFVAHMLDHVFTDAISALRDAFEAAFLERQAFEEHFQSDVLLGDLTWETSYGLPGEGEPPRVVAHITFDWPAWSQAAYRQWYVEEELEKRPAIEMEIVLRIQRLAEPPDPAVLYKTVPEQSPLVGDDRLERAGLTSETSHPDTDVDPLDLRTDYAAEITYEGLYELAEETVADGTSTLLDEHFGALGGWIASTLVKLGDLPLEFHPADDAD